MIVAIIFLTHEPPKKLGGFFLFYLVSIKCQAIIYLKTCSDIACFILSMHFKYCLFLAA